MSKQAKSGKEVQDAFCALNVNALWVKGKGMIFMSSYYGTDCSVAGTYNIFTLETSEDVLDKFASARADGDTDTIEAWLHGRETGRKYQVQ